MVVESKSGRRLRASDDELCTAALSRAVIQRGQRFLVFPRPVCSLLSSTDDAPLCSLSTELRE